MKHIILYNLQKKNENFNFLQAYLLTQQKDSEENRNETQRTVILLLTDEEYTIQVKRPFTELDPDPVEKQITAGVFNGLN